MDQKDITITVAHDGGNGFMKDQINDQRFIYPSVIARVFAGQEPETIEANDTEQIEKVLKSVTSSMDITVQSKSIHINGRYFVGAKAQLASFAPIEFNVYSNEGKSQSDISLISLFSLISYYEINKSFAENKVLPSSLNVVVDKMVTALPIDEIKLKGVKETYAKRFTDNSHIIIVNNFSQPITVNLSFKDVEVQPEGVIAANGLVADSKNCLEARDDGIFDEINVEYGKKFTGLDVLHSCNILGIDVGDGTIDFAVTSHQSTIPTLNSSVFLGVGNAIENAIQALHQTYPSIGKINRQAFMKIAISDNTKQGQVYRQFLDAQLVMLEQQISEQVKTIYRALNGQIGFIFICGGGAVVLKQHFKDSFKKIIDENSPFGSAPILWVSDKYAQTLNLDGLALRLSWLQYNYAQQEK